MLKWIVRLVGGLVAVVIVTAIGLMIAYSVWMADYRRALVTDSQVASTALGEIEYAVAGEGIPMLRIHGRPGGYDQTIAAPRTRPADYAGYQVIAISRPGYLRTPLSSGETPEQQADLYAALLDKLEIKRVVVYGASGGGPSALAFAARHPTRTRELILVVPDLVQSMEARERETTPGAVMMFLQDFGFWVGGQLLGKTMAPMMMPDLDPNDPVAAAQLPIVATAFLASDLRVAGNANDVIQYRQLKVQTWPLESMQVPTLIMHGNADENAPYEGSVAVAKRIPNAKLVIFEGGDHLIIITKAREIGEEIRQFTRGLQ
ncbi:MAG: alpha/beta hydrolase [Candidatus Obscuribacterales bacterium]|nr:alpha/beta hydrolase [Steroidobacteraceae bacterium]